LIFIVLSLALFLLCSNLSDFFVKPEEDLELVKLKTFITRLCELQENLF
jgi:hypothetical protein